MFPTTRFVVTVYMGLLVLAAGTERSQANPYGDASTYPPAGEPSVAKIAPVPEGGAMAMAAVQDPVCPQLCGGSNLSFETGDFTDWVTQDLAAPFYSLTVGGPGFTPVGGFFVSAPTDGDYACLHGFDGATTGTIRVAQDFTIPAETNVIWFDYRAAWDLTPYGATIDRTFSVAIEPAGGGAPLQTNLIMTASAGTTNFDTGDLLGTVDVSDYSGTTVRVAFEWVVPEVNTGPAFFQLDNIRCADEADSDGDGVPDECDQCPVYDDNADADGDGIPDGCDDCPNDPVNDIDGDGVCGDVDNCPLFHNPAQGSDCELPAHVRCVDASALGVDDGTDWYNAFTSLQDALDVASVPANSITEIRVAGGTYKPTLQSELGTARTETFQIINGVTIRGGYGGIANPVNANVRHLELYETILSGDLAGDDIGDLDHATRDENAYHVVSAFGTDDTAVLDGFTVTAGNADGSWPRILGGGMYIDQLSGATVTHCTFSGNQANSGGGLFADYESLPTVTHCTFNGNRAYSEGGGMRIEGGSILTVTHCTFSENAASSGAGLSGDVATQTVSDCTFSENTASTWGGGARIRGGTLTRCSFSENQSQSYGGGLDCQGLVELVDCTFTGNRANSSGGGVHAESGTTVTATNCVFEANTGQDGGGLFSNHAIERMTGCTFSGNTASEIGGGLRDRGDRGELVDCVFTDNTANGEGGGGMHVREATVTGCTFSGNQAPAPGGSGGAIFSLDATTLTDCLLTGNAASGYGGGLYRSGSSSGCTTTGCTFLGNTAGDMGGGVYSFGTETLTNCLFSGNTAFVDGGGMICGYPVLTNCTVSENEATLGSGGGVLVMEGASYSAMVTNCIFWGNTAGATIPGAQIGGVDLNIATISFSCIQGPAPGIPPAPPVWPGTGNIADDPLFVDADGPDDIFGTIDDDLRLSPGSPCIDAANNNADIDEGEPGLQPLPETDLDGLPRIIDDPDTIDTGIVDPPIVDMGAYEYGRDCNENGISDTADIIDGTSADWNANWIPDECEDCNDNALPDFLDLSLGFSDDCNANDLPDECDIASGHSPDLDGNDIPDECEDCNYNGMPDDEDITLGLSADDNGNNVPDECEDCDGSGWPDFLDVLYGNADDCNGNQIPDTCEPDGDGDGTIDECEPPVLTSAISRKLHGTAGDCDIALPLDPPTAAGVETRQDGPTQIVLTFSDPIAADDGVPSANEVSLFCGGGGSAGGGFCGNLDAATIVGDEMTIDLSGIPNAACLTVGLTGISDLDGFPLDGDADVHVCVLKGNVNGDTTTNLIDVAQLKSEFLAESTPDIEGKACFDLNVDGKINMIDVAFAKSLFLAGGSASCP